MSAGTFLTPHFTLEELTHTEVRSASNDVPDNLRADLACTALMLEGIRNYLGQIKGEPVPINVTSGYRSPAVNAAVGGQPGSDHLRAMAADFKAPSFGTPEQICRTLVPVMDELGIGQVIHEFGRWVHVSTRRPDKIINRVITISAAGIEVGVQAVA